jgi:hypothetical protein
VTMNQYPNETNPEHEEYGFMERELAFKLLASHAMVDPGFFDYLRNDPVAAAAHLHIALEDRDVEYLMNDVDWDRLAEMAEPVRASLKLELVTNSW